MKPYELIVFDWDGTLMDSELRIVTCMQLAARAAGWAEPSDAEVREIIGLSMPHAMQRLFPGADEAAVDRLTEAYRAHWLGGQVPESALFPGVRELLDELASRDYLLAVATGKSRRGLDKVLGDSGLRSLFHVTRCADEALSKPHPQMLQDILVDLNTPPGSALMVGDTEYDIQMASNAGVASLGVAHGAHDAQRLLDCGALLVLQQVRELAGWLEGQLAAVGETG